MRVLFALIALLFAAPALAGPGPEAPSGEKTKNGKAVPAKPDTKADKK